MIMNYWPYDSNNDAQYKDSNSECDYILVAKIRYYDTQIHDHTYVESKLYVYPSSEAAVVYLLDSV